MTVWTGTLPTILAGDIPTGDDWNEVLGALHGLTDARATWTPVWTNLTVGNGTVSARYGQSSKAVDVRLKLTLGSTSVVGSSPQFTLPVAAHSSYATDDKIASGQALDAAVLSYNIDILSNGGANARFNVSATSPFTFGSGDILLVEFRYEPV